jgi:hypothetical protein
MCHSCDKPLDEAFPKSCQCNNKTIEVAAGPLTDDLIEIYRQ